MWWLKKQWLRLKLYAGENYYNEAESLIIWYAVSFALGAAFYFTVPYELPVWVIVVYLEAVLVLLWLTRFKRGEFKLLTYAAVFMLGLCVAKADAMYRYRNLEHNLPEISYLRAKIKDMDYGSNARPRLLLTEANNFERDLKGDFRISLNTRSEWLKPMMCVELVAKFPKGYAANPISNYNFARTNFYRNLSATGYSIGPVFAVDCPDSSSWGKTQITKAREHIKNIVNTRSQTDTGAIIKALTIGDRSSIDETLSHHYRTSGLAHFLSISGMHMGIIALLAFFLIRMLLFPAGEGRFDLRKPAAAVSLMLTFVYFLISGQSVSCIRAFVMTTLVMLGVLFNRRAISLRLWAFAVLVVTVLSPVAVISPGFLMSFAAVLGLVAFYEKNAVRVNNWFRRKTLVATLMTYFAGVIITDLVASLMTLPFSIYYFNQISVYTSLGNLLAGPVIAFWVMPCILLFLLSVPPGLEAYTLPPLNAGVEVINKITAWVTSLPGATAGEAVGAMPDWGIFILTFGLLWLCIWQARWRILGVGLIVLGLMSLYFSPAADFVFDGKGTTFAYKGKDGTLKATRWHENRFLEKMWTGTNLKGKYEIPYDKNLTCTDKTCIYKKRIKFGENMLQFDGKDIPLKNGGFINLITGVHYAPLKRNRLWD